MNLLNIRQNLLIVISALSLMHSSWASQYFISPQGNDDNNGNIETPFHTIKPVLQLLETKSDPGDVTVYYREGTYHLDQTIVFQPQHSGSEQYSVLITSWKNENVILSGGIEFNQQWSVNKNGIYQTKIDTPIDELYINNVRYHMARFPNYDENAKFFGGTSKNAISPERIQNWSNPIGGYVHALHEGMWGSKHYRIEGVNPDRTLKLKGGWQENRGGGFDEHFRGGYHKNYLFVENIYEELDAPGEWYLDESKGVLSVIPYENDDLTTAYVVGARLYELIQLKGSEDAPIKNIHFSNLNFQHTARIFMQPYERLLRGDWSISRLSALRFTNAQNCSITNCNFTNLGGNAVFLDGYSRDNKVVDNYFTRLGESAICVVGDLNAVRTPAISYSNTLPQDQIDLTPGPKTKQYPSNCLIEGNLIHNIGIIGKQTAGVLLSMAEEITVRHNTIFDVPRAAICINDGCWGGHIIEYNDAFDTVRESGDHGPFNSWGRDRFWKTSYNGGRDIEPFAKDRALLDNYKTTHIRFNRFSHDAGHSWGIDLDDGSSNYHVYKNLCIGMGVKLREGFFRRVENNIIINGFGGFHVWFPGCDDIIERNIFISNKPYQFIRANPEYAKSFDYNLFYSGGDAPTITGVGKPMTIQEWQQKGFDQHFIIADPQFVSPESGDYRVKQDSPAIRLGFENFPMDSFGVERADFKQRVEKYRNKQNQSPTTEEKVQQRMSNPKQFLGAFINNLIGKDQMSAAGMINETGVLFTDVPTESKAYELGIREGDVLIKINETEITTVSDCLRIYKETKKQNLSFTLFNATEKQVRFQ